MNDLPARLLAKVERLAGAASPGPWTADERYLVARVKGGRPNGEVILTPERNRSEMELDEMCANSTIAAAFGSPDRATAIMSVLMLNAKTPCLLNECGQCAQCISRALIRDLAKALSVEEQSDGS